LPSGNPESEEIFKHFIREVNIKSQMDIRMPEMNGLEATKQIREHNKDIPIIALTAFAFTDDHSKSIEAGFNEHLSKPVKTNELRNMLKKYLN
jgi:CheY-like chemotaxis protein